MVEESIYIVYILPLKMIIDFQDITTLATFGTIEKNSAGILPIISDDSRINGRI